MTNEITVGIAFIIGIALGYVVRYASEFLTSRKVPTPKRLKKADLVKDMQDRMHDRLNEIDLPFGRPRKTEHAPVTAIGNARARTMLINRKETKE